MMRASAFEFRIRVWLHAAIITLGFWAPWNYVRHTAELEVTAANAHTWGILAANIAPYVGHAGDPSNIVTAFNVLLSVAIAVAFVAALLRTWGAAYLGADVVLDGAMHTAETPGVSQIIQAGPFRHLRNPLYLGTFLHVFALALLMSRSGAIFTILAIGILQVRLILGEEAFLTDTLGAPYKAYCDKVPSVVPALRPQVPADGRHPRWGQAFVGEVYMWGVALGFAFLGWRYNAAILIQAVIVSFGLSVVLRAFTPKPKTA